MHIHSPPLLSSSVRLFVFSPPPPAHPYHPSFSISLSPYRISKYVPLASSSVLPLRIDLISHCLLYLSTFRLLIIPQTPAPLKKSLVCDYFGPWVPVTPPPLTLLSPPFHPFRLFPPPSPPPDGSSNNSSSHPAYYLTSGRGEMLPIWISDTIVDLLTFFSAFHICLYSSFLSPFSESVERHLELETHGLDMFPFFLLFYSNRSLVNFLLNVSMYIYDYVPTDIDMVGQ